MHRHRSSSRVLVVTPSGGVRVASLASLVPMFVDYIVALLRVLAVASERILSGENE